MEKTMLKAKKFLGLCENINCINKATLNLEFKVLNIVEEKSYCEKCATEIVNILSKTAESIEVE
ncbi:hypothetical protein [Clostridium sp.]|uniref:hypothetical protein n=1 Tax=Clostridium sp. TaxID=1506 RepID=UPI00261B22AA|nr:hypothetical protein [Clostridium sp.]